MNKSLVGSLAIIFGSLVLSLQLYGLKIIQELEKIKGGSWKTLAIDYAKETPISLSILITIAIIIYGIVLVVGTERIRKLFNS